MLPPKVADDNMGVFEPVLGSRLVCTIVLCWKPSVDRHQKQTI